MTCWLFGACGRAGFAPESSSASDAGIPSAPGFAYFDAAVSGSSIDARSPEDAKGPDGTTADGREDDAAGLTTDASAQQADALPPIDAPVACVDDASESPCWYQPGWSFRRKVTIHGSQVAGELQHFPVLVHIAAPELRSQEYSGNVGGSNGEDLLFTSNDATTRLDHEIEAYQASDGDLVAWVSVPDLPASRDTVIYLYYGNAAAPAQANPSRVWSDGGPQHFAGVWHLGNSGTSDRLDSTAFTNHCTGVNFDGDESTVGKLGKGDEFDGVDDLLSCGAASSLDITGEITISYWIKPRLPRLPRDKWHNGPWKSNYAIYLYGTSDARTTAGVYYRIGNQKHDIWDRGQSDIPPGKWSYVATSFDGAVIRVYVDGILDYSVAVSGSIDLDPGTPLTIGISEGGNGLPLRGAIDEVRISRIARTQEWLTTSFHNQANPQSFVTLSAELAR